LARRVQGWTVHVGFSFKTSCSKNIKAGDVGLPTSLSHIPSK